jgi:hypothetical protein
MDEAEWRACAAPGAMLEQLTRLGKAREKQGRRKMRLFACACCRQAWSKLGDERSRDAVAVSERFADGLASAEEMMKAREAADAVCEDAASVLPQPFSDDPIRLATAALASALDDPLLAATGAASALEWPLGWRERFGFQCQLLRCLFGNPFRAVAVDPGWQTPAVVALALAAYEDRVLPEGSLDSDRLATLADALEDAGCDHREILDHLRGPGPHIRGCWVLDKLLDRE